MSGTLSLRHPVSYREPETLVTRSGMGIDVRPATEDDRAILTTFFDSVSDEDRRFRFLSAIPHVQPDQIARMTDLDHWQTENFLAFDQQGALVASAMLACDQVMTTAEVAISIRADCRGKGIGWTLLEHVATEARRRGVRVLQCLESRDNRAAIDLEREMGFVSRPIEGDPALVMLEVRF